MKIVVADDDPQMLGALRILLGSHGYEVVRARTGKEALDAIVDEHPDLVVLDLGMPRLSGVEVIRAIRGWSRVPILVISGRSDSADKVGVLDSGADDFVAKPFSADELLARIRALTRRSVGALEKPIVRFGAVAVDLGDKIALLRREGGEEPVRLTPTEWQILELLLRNPRKLITQRTILTEIRGPQHVGDTGYLRLYIAQLRKKLEPDPARPRYLLTEPGMGYRFQPDTELDGEV
ncbi:response regulator [Leifsonia poae]|uniref:response regulator n=1 Tax=Leifsonia poae TaxID=110933 RepID=UPI001CBE2DAC|nr:response regulator [Leifsonia poae]